MAEEFKNRLRAAREAKKLTQTELAEKTGLQPSAVSHFETGRRAPSFDNLRRLADALSVTIDYLLGREAEPKASGPIAQQLFRNFGKMNDNDQGTLAEFAEMLIKKQKRDDQK